MLSFRKVLFPLILLVPLLVFTPRAQAYSLSCSAVDGASIFGYDGYEYVYIGSISNPFGSDSIANEFGSYGSEFSSKSVFNEFARWGNEFGSYSATNDFASKPPIIVSENFDKIGYLTANDFRSPSINIYAARACANNSFASSVSDHEDVEFEDEDDLDNLGSNDSVTEAILIDLLCKQTHGSNALGIGTDCYCKNGYEFNTTNQQCETKQITCGTNAHSVGGVCRCNEGHLLSAVTNSCVDFNTSCQLTYGVQSYGNATHCFCKSGFQFDETGKYCVPTPATVVDIQKPTVSTSPEVELKTTSLPERGVYVPLKKDPSLIEKLKGHILLQVEERGEAWFLNAADSKRYYLRDGSAAYDLMRAKGVGIANTDLNKIVPVSNAQEMQTTSSACSSGGLGNRFKGQILLQVQERGEAWYIDPRKCKRVYLQNGEAAYQIMRLLGLGIKNVDLEKIPSF